MAPAFPALPQIDESDFIGIQIGVQLAIGAVFGIVCAVMAPGRGRSAGGWFLLGFFFNCIAIIILLLIPNLKLEEEKQRRQNEETRRLREQLKKERQVADARHETHDTRLAVHDRALGLDTAVASQLPPGSPVPPPLPPAAPARATSWYYAFDGKRHGPVPAAELRALWLDQRVPDATIVWCEGMPDWRPIGEVGDELGDAHA